MNIFYNYELEQWQCPGEEKLTLGKNRQPLITSDLCSSQPFLMKRKGNKVGPLIAILTSSDEKKGFTGNRATFKNIQTQLQLNGGLSFILTTDFLESEQIFGYFFDGSNWRSARFPLPDIIYNRIPSYKEERKLKEIRSFALKHGIPLYNPHFFEKWQTYEQLKQNEKIAAHLPKTYLLQSMNQLKSTLDEFQEVIIKPVLGNRGYGIFTITKFPNGYEVRGNGWNEFFNTLDCLWTYIEQQLNYRKMIIQRKITQKKYQQLPYDLRILVQRFKDNWEVTGIGVRCAGKNAVTTHLPQGGRILSLAEVSEQIKIEEIHQLAIETAHQLEIAYGYLCEFSIDLGCDEENLLWIFEVNSKPMKFDEPEIEKNARNTLLQCFYADADFV